jgi:hypothetical protein
MDDNKQTNMFRANIIYTGKYSGKTGCAFLNATSKEAACNFIEKAVKNALKKSNIPLDCFKVQITVSSQEEVDFYMRNRFEKNYTGLVN